MVKTRLKSLTLYEQLKLVRMSQAKLLCERSSAVFDGLFRLCVILQPCSRRLAVTCRILVDHSFDAVLHAVLA